MNPLYDDIADFLLPFFTMAILNNPMYFDSLFMIEYEFYI
jgi:hypothetical protein